MVFYNSANPAQSCIEPGANFMDIVSHFLIYVIFAVIVYFSAYPRLYKLNSQKPDSSVQDSSIIQNGAASTAE